MNQEEKVKTALSGVIAAEIGLQEAVKQEDAARATTSAARDKLAAAKQEAVRVIKLTGKKQVLWDGQIFAVAKENEQLSTSPFDGIILKDALVRKAAR